jgi:hypothetical protein
MATHADPGDAASSFEPLAYTETVKVTHPLPSIVRSPAAMYPVLALELTYDAAVVGELFVALDTSNPHMYAA